MVIKKKKSTFYNILNTLITQFYLIGTGFILTILITRELGAESKGILVTLQLIPALIISFFDMGIRQSIAYYYSKNIKDRDYLITTSLYMLFLTSFLSIIITIGIYYLFYEEYLNIGYLIPIVLMIPLTLFAIYFRGVLQGLNEIPTINLARNTHQTSYIFLILLLLIFQLLNVKLVLWAEFFAFSLMSYVIFKNVKPELSLFRISFSKIWMKNIVTLGITYALTVFVLRLNYKVDALFLAKLRGPDEVGIYSIGTTIAELIWQIPGAIGVVLFSSNLNKSKKDATESTVRLTRISFVASIILGSILYFISPLLIKLTFGIEFIEASTAIRLLLPGIIFMVVFQILNSDMNAKGKPLMAFKVFLFALIGNCILNFLLIPTYGIKGAAFASTITYVISTIIYMVMYTRFNNINLREIICLNSKDISIVKNKLIRRIK
ncbi:flippase [Planococcus kocurii]|uniref:flippase n=1 Tax=Planococcus kocurii TaxID=1374 RepID=UPI003D086FFB